MTLSEIILATTPRGLYSDRLLSQKCMEEEIVKKWQSIGPQFNVGHWVSDTELQTKILSKSKITLIQHVKSFFIGLKNIFYIVCFFFNVAINRGSTKISGIVNSSEIKISYKAQGSTERVVEPYINGDNSREYFEIVFSENSTLEQKVVKELKISDLTNALLVLSKSLKHIRLVLSAEISYFFKEIWDYHCFQHCAISYMAQRKGIKKIIVVGEGFPRESCLNVVQSLKVIRANVSPSINLDRINTFYWQGEFQKMNTYKFQAKSNFLSNLPPYNKKTLSLENFTKEAQFLNQRVVLVPGFSEFSNKICKKLKLYFTVYSGLEIVIKSHPRRAKVASLQVNKHDIVIAEKSTQFGLIRHFNSPFSKTYYFSNDLGSVFDPAPYANIPLIIDNI